MKYEILPNDKFIKGEDGLIRFYLQFSDYQNKDIFFLVSRNLIADDKEYWGAGKSSLGSSDIVIWIDHLVNINSDFLKTFIVSEHQERSLKFLQSKGKTSPVVE